MATSPVLHNDWKRPSHLRGHHGSTPCSSRVATTQGRRQTAPDHLQRSFEVRHRVHTAAHGPPRTYKRNFAMKRDLTATLPDLSIRECTGQTLRGKVTVGAEQVTTYCIERGSGLHTDEVTGSIGPSGGSGVRPGVRPGAQQTAGTVDRGDNKLTQALISRPIEDLLRWWPGRLR
jgi:hypothetical protein